MASVHGSYRRLGQSSGWMSWWCFKRSGIATCGNLHSVNEALLTLLPKSTEAATLKDYRPISLIHLIGRVISKVLTN
jgi:hypothetical protein